ncbi:MAG TPA: hypothetical protein PKI93_04295 [Alphaproteobacteria bacterium]|nr:hypothetical protein [Alphaproteobacteria bacterium]HNS44085.1 hypothetical protein [Alphaproteobacteria bacterium]
MAEEVVQEQVDDSQDFEVLAGVADAEPQTKEGDPKKKKEAAQPARVVKKKEKDEKPVASWKQNLREMLTSFINGLGLGNFGDFLMEFLHLDKPNKTPEKKPEKQPQAAATAPAQPGKEEPAQSPKPTESQPAAGPKQESSQDVKGYSLGNLDADLAEALGPEAPQQAPHGSGSVVILTSSQKPSSPEDYLCTAGETHESPSSLFLDNLSDITQNQTPLPANNTGIALQMTKTLGQ